MIGYDHRAGVEANRPSLSDTLMLIRADPRDEDDLAALVPARPRRADLLRRDRRRRSATDRINSAYSRCRPKGTLLTVKHLTGLPVNYLITVNFHGFKEVVDKLGGVWMDVDRRYYNKNTGSYLDNYANINLQPGYQKLSGQQALDFVRFRHTDSDLYRLARQQEFVRAFKEQVAQSFSLLERAEPRQRDHAATSRSARAGTSCSGDQVISVRALRATGCRAATLPGQDRERASAGSAVSASPTDIQDGGQRSRTRTCSRRRRRTPPRSARRSSRRRRRRRPSTVTVLNGNGVAGRRGEHVVPARPARLPDADRRRTTSSRTRRRRRTSTRRSTTTRRSSGSKAAAVALQNLMQPADVAQAAARRRSCSRSIRARC